MSDSRRSCRARKVVDYATMGCDDDDFADPTPPSKKPKMSNKENKPSRKKSGVEESQRAKDGTPKDRTPKDRSSNRPALDEKLFDRDLEAAMKLSLQSSPDAADHVTEISVETHCQTEKSSFVTESSLKSIVEPIEINNKRMLSSAMADEDDIIELSVGSEDRSENLRKRRKAAATAVRYDNDSDSDDTTEEDKWNPDKESEHGSDDDDEFDPDDSDSDFGTSKGKKEKDTSRSKPLLKKTPAKPKPKTSVSVTPVNTSQPVGVKRATPKSACRSAPATPSYSTPVQAGVGSMKKAWVPPARGGSMSSPLSSLSMKSPTSGLRLGLSRHQKVKSLHPSVTC